MLALVTGCNRGIGLEICKQLLDKDYDVIGVCRNSSPELQELKIPLVENIDLTHLTALDPLLDFLGDRKIDLLVNNAGVMHISPLNDLSLDHIQSMYQLNAVAPIYLTSKLLKNFNSPAKVAMITSRMGSIEDNDSGGAYGYRMSKAALNSGSKSLSIDLKGNNISVGVIHPGWVKSEMTGFKGLLTPEESANGILQRIDGLNIENSGSFWHSNGEPLPW